MAMYDRLGMELLEERIGYTNHTTEKNFLQLEFAGRIVQSAHYPIRILQGRIHGVGDLHHIHNALRNIGRSFGTLLRRL